jgi:hypothetical protein
MNRYHPGPLRLGGFCLRMDGYSCVVVGAVLPEFYRQYMTVYFLVLVGGILLPPLSPEKQYPGTPIITSFDIVHSIPKVPIKCPLSVCGYLSVIQRNGSW